MQSTKDEIVLELLDVLYPWGAAGAGRLPRRRRREGSKGGHGCVPSSRAADGAAAGMWFYTDKREQ